MNKLIINELVDECNKLFGKFDEISKSVCELEKKLSDAKAFFEFHWNIDSEPSPYKSKISWMKNPGTQNYRIIISTIDTTDQKLIIHKPLMEVSINERMKYVDRLEEFIKKFTSYIKEYNKGIGIK